MVATESRRRSPRLGCLTVAFVAPVGPLDGGSAGFPAAIELPACLPVGGLDTAQRALEPRHDVAGQQLVAVSGLLPGGPLVGADEDAAEAAGALLIPFDRGDQVVGCPDDGAARLDH